MTIATLGPLCVPWETEGRVESAAGLADFDPAVCLDAPFDSEGSESAKLFFCRFVGKHMSVSFHRMNCVGDGRCDGNWLRTECL